MCHTTGAASCCASSLCPDPAWAPVPRALQECEATGSRRAEPRAWLRAVVWLVEAGLHRRAGETTVKVARDLAGRMDYRLGFVLYDLDGTAARCGVSTATVKRHVRVLRELGALVWRRHGSKRNLRLPGRPYAGTATIYAAVIPPVFDEAMGHRLGGVGYEGRVCGVTDAGRARAVEASRSSTRPVDNPVVDNRSSGGRAPHSPGFHHDVPKADLGGGLNYTSRERATATASPPQGLKNSSNGNSRSARASTSSSCSPKRHPLQVARDIVIARQVRPLVGWTQREGLRRLAFALRPLIDHGLEPADIAAELHGLALDWQPARPAAYITAALNRARQQEDATQARVADREHTADHSTHTGWQAWLSSRQEATPEPVRTDDDRRHGRLYGWDQWQEIAAHYDDDPDDALDLYGTRLCTYAVGRAARTAEGRK